MLPWNSLPIWPEHSRFSVESSADWPQDGSGTNALVPRNDREVAGFVPIDDLFKGQRFDKHIIILCVSWYTSFKLSLRDLVRMMADRASE
jgi:hypothetical protein